MKISTKVDYACRVLAELARLHGSGELAQIEHLARVEKLPPNFLAQILSELRNGGLITSRRGIQGGYALARPPDQISLYDIITLIDGAVLELSGNHEGRSGRRIRQVWLEIRESFEEKTKRYTLDQLVTKAPEEMYYI
ncbi:RrF2 family transcriptional regulator [Opitutus terrae]|uniref:Transcriptional regulator, BadM/Rrf2 family n=1 Tax=Opitutus terrae (strain DSM 11246 / JCM 15787 / PB90-1) TaxID=452637 RepID=B1ZSB1_OPITP|nr:Rrf2 family transcriptional regulator [Opitutus terrae]ACB75710.1 transcriptional regulator, BadM/Rrf2 family [Opitutus terrae PB90-1]